MRKCFFLYPFSLLYELITAFRNYLYDSGALASHKFDIPVICVGNITVGGTGKTPHTEYIAGLLKKDFQVAVLSRGYKRKTSGFTLATQSSGVGDIGDEPLQIYRKFPEIIIAVDSDRRNGIKRILQKYPDTQVIILDDGFQHRRVSPGLSILLCDYNRPVYKDFLLPYGRLRESRTNTKRADVIVVTKSPPVIPPMTRRIITEDIGKAPFQKLFFTTFKYANPMPVFPSSGSAGFSRDNIKPDETGVVLVTGIASPGPFREYTGNLFGEIVHLKFSDHHSFVNEDIRKITEAFNKLASPVRYIITTEKDAVRLREFTNIAEDLKRDFYYIGIEVIFFENEKQKFDNLILDYVRKNKRDNRLSQGKRYN